MLKVHFRKCVMVFFVYVKTVMQRKAGLSLILVISELFRCILNELPRLLPNREVEFCLIWLQRQYGYPKL